ncbi:hypothetical protein LCGC14_1608290 [marine sediment metagenome]|uniref:Uncharacterized protein n=1 Tax=marine sediment metagenome TaxID=412755 RepID=A0A0F9KPZ0_9ZZZZ
MTTDPNYRPDKLGPNPDTEGNENFVLFSSYPVTQCVVDGHCIHEGTAIGSLWCCRCHQYLRTTAERLNFYEDSRRCAG